MKINHVLIISSDLEKTNRFWTQVIGLELGDRPPFRFEGAWLYSEGKPIIHVVPGEVDASANGAIDHIALEGSNYDVLIASLRQHGVEYREIDVPLTGEHQVFVMAPDGVKVEILFPSR
ncbi:MAG: VOC family protein [Leucothrix sp.]